jgi:predicted transposase YbfD/YdcC
VHLLAAVTHVPGLVIAQDKVAKAGQANEVTHVRPLLEPLPLDGVLITSDAMQATRDNAAFLRRGKNAHYLGPILATSRT